MSMFKVGQRVRWRESRSKEGWNSGTVKELCAGGLIRVDRGGWSEVMLSSDAELIEEPMKDKNGKELLAGDAVNVRAKVSRESIPSTDHVPVFIADGGTAWISPSEVEFVSRPVYDADGEPLAVGDRVTVEAVVERFNADGTIEVDNSLIWSASSVHKVKP